jgi:hypothetical protein
MVSMDGSWCPSCGYSVQPGTQFCSSCGQRLPAPVGVGPAQPPTVTAQSPSIGGQPLSAPPLMPMPPQTGAPQPPQGGPMPPPPPPAPDSRLPWPPPPGPAAGRQQPPEPQLSDTMDRMLRPQGLFQQPWQQHWPAPAGNGVPPAGAPTPAPPGPYQGSAPYPAGGPPPAYPTEAMGQPTGQYPPSPSPYPPGQYPPGQYPPGQYGGDQFIQGQYPGGPYGPGGYGPPVGYGPGGQFGPDGAPADQKRPLTFGRITLPRSPLVPAIAVAALVIIAVTAIVLSAGGGSGSSSGTAAGGATPTTTRSASAAGAGDGATERQAAKQLARLLQQSGSDRAHVIDAVTNVQGCGKNLGADAQIFRSDAANRRSLLAQLKVMPNRSALSAAMLSDLTGGWQASATVDDDLARWADAAAGHCKGGDKHNPSLQASYAYDSTATNDKVAFTRLWNPLARKDGLPIYQDTQI